MKRFFARFLLICFILLAAASQLASPGSMQDKMKLPESEEALMQQKIDECPFLKNIFKADDKWIFSKENEMLYANLMKQSRTFIFGYKPQQKRDWGEHLPRWYFAVGSVELGLVIASFNGVVKDGKYIVNNMACISKKCPHPDINASLNFNGMIGQISIDENCDRFFDKIYSVDLKPDINYAGKEAWAQAARLLSDNLNRLSSGKW